jgi:S-DNA-T family DNA segregation ATPase FtsK/SpoIIIE
MRRLLITLRGELSDRWKVSDVIVDFAENAQGKDLLEALSRHSKTLGTSVIIARSGDEINANDLISSTAIQNGDRIDFIPTGKAAQTKPVERPEMMKPSQLPPTPSAQRPAPSVGGNRPMIPTSGQSMATSTGGRPLLPVGAAATASAVTKSASLATKAPPRPVPKAATPPRVEKFRTLDFVSGPEAGRCLNVSAGAEVFVGRDDSRVGRRGYSVFVSEGRIEPNHVVIRVAADLTATVTAVAAPITVNDSELLPGQTKTIEVDDIVRAGDHGFAVRRYERREATRDRLMQLEFRPTPYRPTVVTPTKLDPLQPIPEEPTRNRLQWLAMLMPLLIGGVMLAVSLSSGSAVDVRTFVSVGFMLMSPVLILGNFLTDRRRGKKTYREQLRDFEELLSQRVQEAEESRQQERVARWQAVPDLPSLSRRAIYRSPELWQRHRSADDLLTLRLGEYDTESLVTCDIPDRGDRDLRERATIILAPSKEMRDVPYAVSIADLGVIAITGDAGKTIPVAASLLAQVATLHSPEDVVTVVLAPSAGAASDAMLDLARAARFLPHSRSLSSPLPGAHVATSRERANEVLGTLIGVAYERLQQRSSRQTPKWPWVAVFVDERVNPSPVLMAQLADMCPDAAISLVVTANSTSEVTRRAKLTLALNSDSSTVIPVDPEQSIVQIRPTTVRAGSFWETVRALSPLRDATERKAMAAIPRVADLFLTLSFGPELIEEVKTRWERSTRYSLLHPIGIGQSGPFSIDLIADGPHMLIGGTSGSGKSELMMSIIASLAANYPPERVNFLFFDYKGGAGTQMFDVLPHTVGSVTNLDGDLALRALTSLRAELNYRMKLITEVHGCKDLKDMLERHPEGAPPSLVLVFDEFATLVKEVPEFVNGVVDVAQRGRSLGIHLILATQRPSGAINENIQANTNIRIALRMVDAGESSSVLGSPDAAEIPTPLRGRAFVRLGPKQILPVQSAFTGAPSIALQEALVQIRDIEDETVLDQLTESSGPTQGQVLVDAIVKAWQSTGRELPRRPWCPELPDMVALSELESDVSSSDTRFPIGLLDDPERQQQPVAHWDVRSHPSIFVFGGGSSGKTSFLRHLGEIVGDREHLANWSLALLDFGTRGLGNLASAPNLVARGNADDLESVTRTLRYVALEVQKRRSLLSERACDSMDDLRHTGVVMPRLLVLVDDFHNLASCFAGVGASQSAIESEMGMLSTAIMDSRSCGVHFVVTVDRRASVRSNVFASVTHRVVLRQSDELGYFEFGVPLTKGAVPKMPAGRGFWIDNRRLQCCMPALTSQPVSRLGSLLRSGRVQSRSAALPEKVLAENTSDGRIVQVGIQDVTSSMESIDITRNPLAIIGPRESGKTNAIRWFASQFALLQHKVVRSNEDLEDVEPRTLLLIDEADRLADDLDDSRFRELRFEHHCPLVVAVNARNTNMVSGWLREALRDATYLVLQPDDRHSNRVIQDLFDRTPYIRPGLTFPPGRGLLSVRRGAVVVQVPWMGDSE